MATGFIPIPIQHPSLGARVRRWISKTFRRRPEKRPPSAEQMEALRRKYPPKPSKTRAA